MPDKPSDVVFEVLLGPIISTDRSGKKYRFLQRIVAARKTFLVGAAKATRIQSVLLRLASAGRRRRSSSGSLQSKSSTKSLPEPPVPLAPSISRRTAFLLAQDFSQLRDPADAETLPMFPDMDDMLPGKKVPIQRIWLICICCPFALLRKSFGSCPSSQSLGQTDALAPDQSDPDASEEEVETCSSELGSTDEAWGFCQAVVVLISKFNHLTQKQSGL